MGYFVNTLYFSILEGAIISSSSSRSKQWQSYPLYIITFVNLWKLEKKYKSDTGMVETLRGCSQVHNYSINYAITNNAD